MTNKPIVVITGANGFLGTALTKHFTAKGWQVRGLVRTVPEKSPKNIQYFAYDLEGAVPAEAFKGADYLVHTAYVKFNPKNQNALKVNVTAAKRLLKVADANKLKKKLFMSTMSAHKEAESVYGKQKLQIEKLFSDRKSVVIRSGLILGNGGIVKDMADFMKSKHAVPLVGGGKQPLQVIGNYDLCRVVEILLVGKLSGLFTVATPTVYTYKEFYKALAKQINTPVVFVPLPFFALIGAIKTIRFLHLPLNVSEDNALGLKQLRSAETAPDLKKIGVQLDDLETVLKKPGIIK